MKPPPPLHESAEQQIASTSASVGVLVFLVACWALFGHRLKRIHLTEGSAACLLGLLCGLLLLALQQYLRRSIITNLLAFSAASFFTYLLPPVIFYAGLSIEKRLFFTHLAPILALGIGSTAIAFVLISAVLYAGFAGFRILKLQDCLALGAIFSATDSVATLQVLSADSHPVLFSLVFGEGVINDATSVVLLGAVNHIFPSAGAPSILGHPPSSHAGSPPGAGGDGGAHIAHAINTTGADTASSGSSVLFGHMLMTFLWLFLSSLGLGVAMGGGISWLAARYAGHGPHHEVAIIGLLSYLGYLAAEASGISGILCLFSTAIVISQYALPNLSVAGRNATLTAFRSLSWVAEGIIFIYLGLDAIEPSKWMAAHAGEALSLSCALLLLLLVSRAVSVLPVIAIHNMLRPFKVSSTDAIIIWWSGLMRGAVSVALATAYFDLGSVRTGGSAGLSGDKHRATLVVATLLTVLITIVVLGWLTQPFLASLTQQEPSYLAEKLGPVLRRVGNFLGIERGAGLQGRAGSVHHWSALPAAETLSDGGSDGRWESEGGHGRSGGSRREAVRVPADVELAVNGDQHTATGRPAPPKAEPVNGSASGWHSHSIVSGAGGREVDHSDDHREGDQEQGALSASFGRSWGTWLSTHFGQAMGETPQPRLLNGSSSAGWDEGRGSAAAAVHQATRSATAPAAAPPQVAKEAPVRQASGLSNGNGGVKDGAGNRQGGRQGEEGGSSQAAGLPTSWRASSTPTRLDAAPVDSEVAAANAVLPSVMHLRSPASVAGSESGRSSPEAGHHTPQPAGVRAVRPTGGGGRDVRVRERAPNAPAPPYH